MSETSANHSDSRTVPKRLLSAAPWFDHEKLDAYQLELQFIAWVKDLLEEVAGRAAGKTAEVCDQLDRASLSALLNTAEGNGKRQRQVRARFFDDARGSATESAACLDALVAKRAVTEDRILEGKQMLVRIVSMLCGLIDRFDTARQLREGSEQFGYAQVASVKPVRYRNAESRTSTLTRRRTKR